MSKIINVTSAETEAPAYNKGLQFQGLTKSCAIFALLILL